MVKLSTIIGTIDIIIAAQYSLSAKALGYLPPGKFPPPSASIVEELSTIIGTIDTIIVAQYGGFAIEKNSKSFGILTLTAVLHPPRDKLSKIIANIRDRQENGASELKMPI